MRGVLLYREVYDMIYKSAGINFGAIGEMPKI